jgi:hypothetical protein
VCTAGACGFSFAAAATPVLPETPHDCKMQQCDGAGNIVSVAYDADLPVDGNACTADVCTAGKPSNPPAPKGAACDQNGGMLCNGAGSCVACLATSDCPGADTECKTRLCAAGTCAFTYAPLGKATAAQVAGDCHQNQCDGSGNVVGAIDDGDLPQDASQCTNDVCTAGAPSNPPLAAGTACNQNGGAHCNGSGACVQCATASDCPGADTDCKTRTCAAGVCGENDKPAGTIAKSQVTGDCHQYQCDASGNIASVVDNGDLPVDGNACTLDQCAMGTPSNPPAAAGTSCGSGLQCNGSGACVAGCFDGKVDGSETDVDCGGGACGACGSYLVCKAPSDCASGACIGGKCACGGTHLVISEVRSRGASAADEYIELFNPTANDIVLSVAWKVEARSSSAVGYTSRWTGDGSKSIPAHGHFLIVGTGYASPPNPAGDDPMSTGITDASSIRLTQAGVVVDAVCYATDAATSAALQAAGYACEGAPLINADATKSIERKPGAPLGNCVDTDVNTSDFAVGAASSPQDRLSNPTP